MRNRLIILIAVFGILGLIIWGGFHFFVMMSGMEPIPIRTEIIDDLSNEKSINLVAPSSQEHIHALFLEVTGNINDGGLLTILYNDTVTYRKIELSRGAINFLYDGGDWYANNCLLKFTPNSVTTRGDIKIDYKFYGL